MEPSPSPKLSHSWLGIASCILGFAAGCYFVFMLVVAIFITTLMSIFFGSISGGRIETGVEPWFVATSAIGIAIALGLGIAGLRQPDGKRLFPVLGCTFSAIAALSLLAMLLL